MSPRVQRVEAAGWVLEPNLRPVRELTRKASSLWQGGVRGKGPSLRGRSGVLDYDQASATLSAEPGERGAIYLAGAGLKSSDLGA